MKKRKNINKEVSNLFDADPDTAWDVKRDKSSGGDVSSFEQKTTRLDEIVMDTGESQSASTEIKTSRNRADEDDNLKKREFAESFIAECDQARNQPEPEKKEKQKPKKCLEEQQPEQSQKEAKQLNHGNPLGLIESDLEKYRQIKQKYGDSLNLIPENPEFIDYYRFKFKAVKTLLEYYSMVDFKSIDKKMSDINVHHYLNSDQVDFNKIRIKLDQVLQQKSHLTDLMHTATNQFSMWKEMLHLLRDKLCKDHPVRGAEKRGGLIAEHLLDITVYVSGLEGTLAAGKRILDMLNSCHDSLSRQLSCVDYKQPRGIMNAQEVYNNSSRCHSRTDDGNANKLLEKNKAASSPVPENTSPQQEKATPDEGSGFSLW